MSDDNMRRACGDCRYWRKNAAETGKNYDYGECKRLPPTIGVDGQFAQWPQTHPLDYCWEFADRGG